ncbi:MAG: helix-turn-helix domain-containing protein [Halobacteriaceae archaeon]
MAQSDNTPKGHLDINSASFDDDISLSQDVLDALGDSDCRLILRELNEPMTAQEISEKTDLPLSSTYRKLDFLSDTILLKEEIEIRENGNHTTYYAPDFEAVRVVVDKNKE